MLNKKYFNMCRIEQLNQSQKSNNTHLVENLYYNFPAFILLMKPGIFVSIASLGIWCFLNLLKIYMFKQKEYYVMHLL